jgi:predicted NUDIX family NTP pyrophosphohydrolase
LQSTSSLQSLANTAVFDRLSTLAEARLRLKEAQVPFLDRLVDALAR